MITDPNRIGDMAEIESVTWLWKKGYEVFRNVGCTGKIDIIAIKDKEILKIDVKSVRATAKFGELELTTGNFKRNSDIVPLWFYKGHISFTKWDLIDFIDDADKAALAPKIAEQKARCFKEIQ